MEKKYTIYGENLVDAESHQKIMYLGRATPTQCKLLDPPQIVSDIELDWNTHILFIVSYFVLLFADLLPHRVDAVGGVAQRRTGRQIERHRDRLQLANMVEYLKIKWIDMRVSVEFNITSNLLWVKEFALGRGRAP